MTIHEARQPDDKISGCINELLHKKDQQIIKALAAMGATTVTGAQPGAMTWAFQPTPLRGGTYQFDIGTAGAIPLFLQTLVPVALFLGEPLSFRVSGGTAHRGAMTIQPII
ncbi:MAG: hypothetical protein KF832_21775 [Caldilineaceae bacterium]|nr:hypothetical protein [Caldilineaceae bacterium]